MEPQIPIGNCRNDFSVFHCFRYPTFGWDPKVFLADRFCGYWIPNLSLLCGTCSRVASNLQQHGIRSVCFSMFGCSECSQWSVRKIYVRIHTLGLRPRGETRKGTFFTISNHAKVWNRIFLYLHTSHAGFLLTGSMRGCEKWLRNPKRCWLFDFRGYISSDKFKERFQYILTINEKGANRVTTNVCCFRILKIKSRQRKSYSPHPCPCVYWRRYNR